MLGHFGLWVREWAFWPDESSNADFTLCASVGGPMAKEKGGIETSRVCNPVVVWNLMRNSFIHREDWWDVVALTSGRGLHIIIGTPGWRNWQTRMVEGHVGAIPCGFKSRPRHSFS